MTFSEDPSSPAAPFSGDSSGQIFDLPDMVASSPTTNERIVDTQSGFLVVVKKWNDRLALSVKRRVGTPPSSSVPLTPDESLKLSRILSTSFTVVEESWTAVDPTQRKERRISERRREERRLRREAALLGEDGATDDDDDREALLTQAQSSNGRQVATKVMLASVLRSFMVPILGVTLSVFALGIGAGVTGLNMVSKEAKPAVPLVVDPLEPAKVDSFVRDFIGKMLDFSAKTYRISQVQAMASMAPDLLEQYWKETNFPLPSKRLSTQGANILITELKQERIDESTAQVDVKAMLSDANNPKIATPVNLRLKLAIDNNRQIVVTEQRDLSTGK